MNTKINIQFVEQAVNLQRDDYGRPKKRKPGFDEVRITLVKADGGRMTIENVCDAYKDLIEVLKQMVGEGQENGQ